MRIEHTGQGQQCIAGQFRIGLALLCAQFLQRFADETIGMQRLDVVLGRLEPQRLAVPHQRAGACTRSIERHAEPAMRAKIAAAVGAQLQHVVAVDERQAFHEPVDVRRHRKPRLELLPPELPGTHRLDVRLRAGARNRYQQRLPRFVGPEPVGLGRAGIPGTLVDLPGAVPVAEREIAQPGLPCPPCRDRIGRVDVLRQDALHAAVRQPDARQAAVVGRARKPLGEIAVGVALCQRRRQQHELSIDEMRFRLEAADDIRRDRAQPLRTAPDGLAQRRVVVSRNQQPGARKALHRIEHAPDGLVRHGLQVEHVACHQHGVDIAFVRNARQPFDGLEARLEQRRGVVRLELREHAADLPVRGVEQRNHARPSFASRVFTYSKRASIL